MRWCDKATKRTALTHNGNDSFHLFEQLVFTEFQINFHCCARKREKNTDKHGRAAHTVHISAISRIKRFCWVKSGWAYDRRLGLWQDNSTCMHAHTCVRSFPSTRARLTQRSVAAKSKCKQFGGGYVAKHLSDHHFLSLARAHCAQAK